MNMTTRFDQNCEPNHHMPVCKQAELINQVQGMIGRLYESLYDETDLENPLYQLIDRLGDASAASQESGAQGWCEYADLKDEWEARSRVIRDLDSQEAFGILQGFSYAIFNEMAGGLA